MRTDCIIFRDYVNKPKNKRCNIFMWFVFNPQKRKNIYIIIPKHTQTVFTCGIPEMQISLLLAVVAFSEMCEPHSTLVPCRKIDCPISLTLVASSLPQTCPLFNPQLPTCVTQFLSWKTTLAHGKPFPANTCKRFMHLYSSFTVWLWTFLSMSIWIFLGGGPVTHSSLAVHGMAVNISFHEYLNISWRSWQTVGTLHNFF